MVPQPEAVAQSSPAPAVQEPSAEESSAAQAFALPQEPSSQEDVASAAQTTLGLSARGGVALEFLVLRFFVREQRLRPGQGQDGQAAGGIAPERKARPQEGLGPAETSLPHPRAGGVWQQLGRRGTSLEEGAGRRGSETGGRTQEERFGIVFELGVFAVPGAPETAPASSSGQASAQKLVSQAPIGRQVLPSSQATP